uniref:CUB domain-containing protein n=1 Tax=Panagrellus redivivus TaxID=6233 RepID=A0A7E4VGX5_PANRE
MVWVADAANSDDFAAVMTCFVTIIFMFCLGICDIQGKVVLNKGQIARVSFDGDELLIVVDNSAGNNGYLQICFASSPEDYYRLCPSGFTGTIIAIKRYTKREFTLNREGQFLKGGFNWEMLGTAKFNEDRTINITATEVPDPRTLLILQNAEIFVPEKPEKLKNVTKKNSDASVRIAAFVVVLILVSVIIGILVWFCVIRKPESEQMAQCADQDDSPSQKCRRSTPQKSPSKKSVKRASNTTPTTICTTVIPKQSPSMAKSLNYPSWTRSGGPRLLRLQVIIGI